MELACRPWTRKGNGKVAHQQKKHQKTSIQKWTEVMMRAHCVWLADTLEEHKMNLCLEVISQSNLPRIVAALRLQA